MPDETAGLAYKPKAKATPEEAWAQVRAITGETTTAGVQEALALRVTAELEAEQIPIGLHVILMCRLALAIVVAGLVPDAGALRFVLQVVTLFPVALASADGRGESMAARRAERRTLQLLAQESRDTRSAADAAALATRTFSPAGAATLAEYLRSAALDVGADKAAKVQAAQAARALGKHGGGKRGGKHPQGETYEPYGGKGKGAKGAGAKGAKGAPRTVRRSGRATAATVAATSPATAPPPPAGDTPAPPPLTEPLCGRRSHYYFYFY